MPILSTNNNTCCLCKETIAEAEIVTPLMAEVIKSDEKYQLVYAHPGCVKDEHFHRIPVCKHWKTKGTCVYQTSCQFRHPKEEAGSMTKARGRFVPYDCTLGLTMCLLIEILKAWHMEKAKSVQ